MTAIITQQLAKHYPEVRALDGVSIALEEHRIHGLLGRNGAGKTTLMQLLTGHRVPTSGSVEVLGDVPYENEAVLSQICFVKEGQRYPDHFRVRDALDAAGLVFPGWDADLAAELLHDFDLPPKRPIKKLSRGMTSAVGIVVLLIDRGRVLLDADAESLRGSAVTVTGATERVAAFSREHDLLTSESLAGQSRAVVRLRHGADAGEAATAGLSWEPVTLQQLVVAMSLRAARTDSIPRTDLEEVSR